MSPGKHKLKITHSGFADYEKMFLVDANNENIVAVGLTPNSSEGKTYKSQNQDEFLQMEGFVSKQFNSEGKTIIEKYPILSNLPYTADATYRIDYGVSKKYPDDKYAVAIYIGANTPQARQIALWQIIQMGYDPTDFEIIFQNLEPTQ